MHEQFTEECMQASSSSEERRNVQLATEVVLLSASYWKTRCQVSDDDHKAQFCAISKYFTISLMFSTLVFSPYS